MVKSICFLLHAAYNDTDANNWPTSGGMESRKPLHIFSYYNPSFECLDIIISSRLGKGSTQSLIQSKK